MKKEMFGGILIVMGLILMAGSGGDCDGKCMENANTITEMLQIAGIGLCMTLLGGYIVTKTH